MQRLLTRFFGRLMKSWSWILLILLTIGVKWASWYPDWVEAHYSNGVYPWISRVQRFLTGWLPFSFGDLFYGLLILIVLYQTWKFFRYLFRKQMTRSLLVQYMQQGIFFLLFIYVGFNLLWGLNYNRKGIASQLQLTVAPYTLADLDTLTTALQLRLNQYAATVTDAQRDSFNQKKRLFAAAGEAYAAAAKKYRFLRYQTPAIKPSLYSYLGNYLGFQGYYNPFTGEAQVNTTIPRFLEPFVATHEIGHQLGYAKEMEANFAGFLACRESPSSAFRYSMYLDMYSYALLELYPRDSSLARSLQEKVHPQVKKDQQEYRAFINRHRNPVEVAVTWGYGHFLRANNQPSGKRSYNEVVGWLVAFYKKFGVAAL